MRQKWLFSILLVLLALAAGLLQLLPSVFLERAVLASGGEFLITQITHHGDTAIHYLPKAREVLDGHFPALDLHVAENRQTLFLWPPGPQLLFASFLAASDDVNHAYMAAGFVFTVVMFLAFSWLGYMLLESRLGAALFALIGVLTPAATHLPQAFFSPGLFADIIGKNFIPVVRSPILQLFLSRIEFPLLVLWLYIIVFALLFRFFRAPTAGRGIAFGISAGLLAYFYTHAWMFIAILAAVLFVLARWRQGEPIAPWLWAVAAMIAVSVPYVVNYLMFNRLPQAADILYRIGFEYGWGIRLSVWRHYTIYAALAGLAWFLIGRLNERKRIFAVAIPAAMVIGLNVQLALGWNPQPDHWLKVFAMPLFLLSAVVVAEAVRRVAGLVNFRWSRGAFISAGFLLLALLMAKKIVNAAYFRSPAPKWIEEYSFPKPIASSWQWLNHGVPPDAVVLSNSLITSIYLTGYTGTDPYLPFAQNTVASNREVEDRFLTVHKLFGTPPARLAEILAYRKNPFSACSQPCSLHTAMNLTKAPAYLYGQLFNQEFNLFDSLAKESGVSNYAIPPGTIRVLLDRYKALKVSWSDFRGAYVYVGPWERELTAPNLEADPGFERIYLQDGVEIYRIR